MRGKNLFAAGRSVKNVLRHGNSWQIHLSALKFLLKIHFYVFLQAKQQF
jgi:hypothetical protein